MIWLLVIGILVFGLFWLIIELNEIVKIMDDMDREMFSWIEPKMTIRHRLTALFGGTYYYEKGKFKKYGPVRHYAGQVPLWWNGLKWNIEKNVKMAKLKLAPPVVCVHVREDWGWDKGSVLISEPRFPEEKPLVVLKKVKRRDKTTVLYCSRNGKPKGWWYRKIFLT